MIFLYPLLAILPEFPHRFDPDGCFSVYAQPFFQQMFFVWLVKYSPPAGDSLTVSLNPSVQP